MGGGRDFKCHSSLKYLQDAEKLLAMLVHRTQSLTANFMSWLFEKQTMNGELLNFPSIWCHNWPTYSHFHRLSKVFHTALQHLVFQRCNVQTTLCWNFLKIKEIKISFHWHEKLFIFLQFLQPFTAVCATDTFPTNRSIKLSLLPLSFVNLNPAEFWYVTFDNLKLTLSIVWIIMVI